MSASVSSQRPGLAKPGYCKICDSGLTAEVNRRLKVGLSSKKIIEYTTAQGLPLSKPTVLKHKAHVTDPMVTFVKRAQRDPAIRPVSDDAYLDAVRDAAARNVASDPSQVTISQGIKAIQARPRRGPDHNILMVIAGLVTDRDPSVEVIDVPYREVLPQQTEDSP